MNVSTEHTEWMQGERQGDRGVTRQDSKNNGARKKPAGLV